MTAPPNRDVVPDHLERFCGPIVEGWDSDPDGHRMPFQIVKLAGGPFASSNTFSTLGLSNHPLKSRRSGKLIRHELLMLTRDGKTPANLPVILQQVAAEAIHCGFAYIRGEVIGPHGRMFKNSEVVGLYVAIPVYFPDNFASVSISDNVEVVFAWLIPITQAEIGLLNLYGWEELEAEFLRNDPDLLDFNRLSAPIKVV